MEMLSAGFISAIGGLDLFPSPIASFRSVLSRSKKLILKALNGGQNACAQGT